MVFDANAFQKDNPTDKTFPVGWYLVNIETSEQKPTTKGFDMVTLKVRLKDSTNGHFINAINWENLTIGHGSPTVAKIAKEKLSEIMLACNQPQINVWGELSNSADFAMEVRKSQQSGKTYAVYKPLAKWFEVVQKFGKATPAPKQNAAGISASEQALIASYADGPTDEQYFNQ
jgi:hypothetical protein